MTETEIWTKWESQVVNGAFPLRRFLGRSNHSVVFLTECRAQNLANAAIKIIPAADPARAESQLSRWELAASLSHPRLMRLLEAGRCKLGGHPFLFVVTEYAEQNLAQILPHRALTVEEVRELLIPTLDALGFLHRQNWVHGHLKPPNFLVVNDQLKLASDTIHAANDTADLAADMRGLGATLIEALTQIRPAFKTPSETPSLPAGLSPGLAAAVQRCLSPERGNRPTVSELRELLVDPALEASPLAPPEPAMPAPAESVPAVAVPAVPAPAVPAPAVLARAAHPAAVSVRPKTTAAAAITGASVLLMLQRAAAMLKPRTRWLVPVVAVGLVLLALWGGSRALRSHAGPPRPISQAVAAQQIVAPATPSSVNAPPPASSVVHDEIPSVSHSARDSIHGQIKVAVRVTVDRAGNVVAENLEVHGSSRYFARLASDAARKWKFAPADNQSPRDWLIQFEFSRGGVTGYAVPHVRQ